MPKFRKKPVIIEAVRYTRKPGNLLEITQLVGSSGRQVIKEGSALIIPTLEGDMRADPGNWIIKGIKGEPYPCKPDIFKETYELVE